MNGKGTQRPGKQLLYFTDRAAMEACADDVIKILIPTGKYCAHDLNFVNCFLNNTPPKAQQFILHWGSCRNQHKGFRQDVFEIITVQLTRDGGEREVHYLIPVPVLFETLGLTLAALPNHWFEEYDGRACCPTHKELAGERMCVYNEILGEYCKKHDIAFHNLQGCVKKKTSYMKSTRF